MVRKQFVLKATLKKTPKVHCLYKVEMFSVTEIYEMNRKRGDRCKYLLFVGIDIHSKKDLSYSVSERIVYVRQYLDLYFYKYIYVILNFTCRIINIVVRRKI